MTQYPESQYHVSSTSGYTEMETCCECHHTFAKHSMIYLDTPDGDKYICEKCEDKVANT